ncbi:MAG TPA: YCF48-related protein [Acidisarcina sp.]
MKSLFCCLLLLVASCSLYATDATWIPVGPDGGDARRFAADPGDPKHLYLGTTSSWLYESADGGSSWKRLAKLSKEENLVLDSIIVDASDPKTLLIGTWVFDHAGGALFVSHDGGSSWTRVKDMDGQSIRALAEAHSDPKIYVAGTLTGVYRSEDHGEHWTLISPEGSKELHEVESVAVDPSDTKIIFAGTWHLPWKTTDGGTNWHTIKQGVIDDSDVFSIILDPKQSGTMYASACSGIYKSVDAGELFHKVQGIPATARRTRVLMQDPVNLDVVYAGTTEGLYQTANGGSQWARMTGPDVVVNDVYVDPSNRQHVLMATDRSGVMMSDDAAASFHDANAGFSQRQVAALLSDIRNPHTLYAGVLNDKGYGGVFVSEDSGSHWKQQSSGLGGLDVFSLGEAADGTLLAGTNHGIFRSTGSTWEANGRVVLTTTQSRTVVVHKKRKVVSKTVTLPATAITNRVNALDLHGDVWYAATSTGIYRSENHGASWDPAHDKPEATSSSTSNSAAAVVLEPKAGLTVRHGRKTPSPAPEQVAAPVAPPAVDYRFIDASGPVVYAAGRQSIARSEDQGRTWQTLTPGSLTSVEALATAPGGEVWIGGREGAFYSSDKGETWTQLKGLPMVGISGLTYDAALKRILVTSWQSTLIFGIDPTDKTWKWWEAGWNVHAVRSAEGRLLGASRYDGVVMQPQGDAASVQPTSSGR